ncbi:MAG: histidine phosphatase family protein [Microbacterium sp.]|uniref:Phosphohistidine phosphatase n=1 Tax=Microbacterium natoriense TaxID=284570 RepID=A0AAW8F2J4_9MICO|nr:MULTISPECIES: histidine phosphatase family protein [Microbacterium]MBW8761057.1 histidine phosphatase family protein [Microbacterium sp.]MDQ0649733.1 phosphohistidine phosphatase [Microbacterium natoriense]
MKTLLLARHAKSDWDVFGAADHDRTLNSRGRRDAPAMARRLIDDGLRVDRIVSSSAARARSTADDYAAAFGLAVVEEPLLYEASSRSILAIAAALPDESEVAMLVGHNPGMSDAVGELTGAFEGLPTCAVAECAVDVGSWAELIEGTGRLLRVRTPRDDE